MLRGAILTSLFLLVLFGATACENADKAKLKSLPIPEGSEFERIEAPRVQLVGTKHIVYRVPMPLEEATAEVFRVFEEEGWRVIDRSGAITGINLVARDGDCVSIHVQWWVESTEFNSDDSTLTLGLGKAEDCGL